jgi:hypothetical protein
LSFSVSFFFFCSIFYSFFLSFFFFFFFLFATKICSEPSRSPGTAQDVERMVVAASKGLETARLLVMYCGKRLATTTALDQTGIAAGDVLQVMVFPVRK